MFKFKKMWTDLNDMVDNGAYNFNIDSELKNVFIIKDQGETTLLTKDDFVDFWAKILLFHQVNIDPKDLKNDKKLYYVCSLLKGLPYIKEEKGNIVLM